MALIMPYRTRFLVTFPDAYFRVSRVVIDYDRPRPSLDVAVYPQAETRRTDVDAAVTMETYLIYNTTDDAAFDRFFNEAALSPEGMNPVKAAYLYLRTLGSFADAREG